MQDRKVLTTYHAKVIWIDERATFSEVQFGAPDYDDHSTFVIFSVEGNAPEKGAVVWVGAEIFDDLPYRMYPAFDSAEKALEHLLKESSLRDAIADPDGTDRSHDEEEIKNDLLAGKVYDGIYAIVSFTLP